MNWAADADDELNWTKLVTATVFENKTFLCCETVF